MGKLYIVKDSTICLNHSQNERNPVIIVKSSWILLHNNIKHIKISIEAGLLSMPLSILKC